MLSNDFLTWNQLQGASGTFNIHNNEHISLIQTADKEWRVFKAIKAAAKSTFSTGLVNESGVVMGLQSISMFTWLSPRIHYSLITR